MGQYFLIINMDKKQYLHAHKFKDGLKAWEIAAGGQMLKGLSLLLTKSDGGGGGDFQEDPTGIVGSWAGDRIWIVGDYDSSKLYDTARQGYENISEKVIPILKKEDLWEQEGGE
jgi:hypothetical protein